MPTFLKEDRASRSLAKTGFFLGLVGTFFAFFSNVFLTSMFLRCFFDFGGVLEAKMAPKIDFWSHFLDAFSGPSFLNVFC